LEVKTSPEWGIAKTLIFYIIRGGYKIGPEVSKCFPTPARVVLVGVSWYPGSPSGGVRGGKPPQKNRRYMEIFVNIINPIRNGI
jgi:hypothetical protein